MLRLPPLCEDTRRRRPPTNRGEGPGQTPDLLGPRIPSLRNHEKETSVAYASQSWYSVRAARAETPALPDPQACDLRPPLLSDLLPETPDCEACENCRAHLHANFIDCISIVTLLSHFFDDMSFVFFSFCSLVIQQIVLEHLFLVRRWQNDKALPWSVWSSRTGVDESQPLGDVSAPGTGGSILPSSPVRDTMMPSPARDQRPPYRCSHVLYVTRCHVHSSCA